jgi:hypothetical protein
MEAERNRQYLDMKEKMDKRASQREREKASQEKRMAFFVGTIGKNANLQATSTTTPTGGAGGAGSGAGAGEEENEKMTSGLSKKLRNWKTDMHELERVRKPISFERLSEFLEEVNKFEGKDMEGIYLSGPDYAKYRKLLERVIRLEELLKKLKAIGIKGSLADINKMLKFFGFLKELIEEYERRRGYAKRIGGGYVVFGDDEKLLEDLFKFVPNKDKKNKPKVITTITEEQKIE